MKWLGRSKLSAGLDIGSGFVKLVVVDHSKSEPEIKNVVMKRLVSDAIVEGEVMDPVLVVDTIESVIEEAGLKRTKIVVAVGGHDVIVKRIQTDRMKEKDARDMIRWEAEQHVPFDMDSVELDFQILDPEADSPEMSVLLVAAKQELVETRLTLLEDAGLNASIVDVDALALHNAFAHNYPEAASGVVAEVNVGHEATNMNLVENGEPLLVRDIPFGSRLLREELQREQGLSADQAEEVLQGRQQVPDLETFVGSRVDELAVGIERAAAFVLAQAEASNIGKVFVSGGGGCVPGLVDALGTRLGIPTERAHPLERVGIDPDVMQTMDVDEFAPIIMLGTGLALRRA